MKYNLVYRGTGKVFHFKQEVTNILMYTEQPAHHDNHNVPPETKNTSHLFRICNMLNYDYTIRKWPKLAHFPVSVVRSEPVPASQVIPRPQDAVLRHRPLPLLRHV